MTPTLSVVVVTYRSEEVIGDCLAALDRAAPRAEVIVVDNGSDDGTIPLVDTHHVRLVASEVNLGFARAANIGARAATGDLVCFVNPDCTLTRAAVERAVAVVDPSEPIAASPRFVHDDGSELEGCQPGYTPRKLLADVVETAGSARVSRWLRRSGRHHDPTWNWPVGACVFVGRRPFLDVGGFDERFFMYMEDVVLGHALASAGGRTIGLDVAVHHSCRRGSAVDAATRVELLDASRIDYALRFHGPGLARVLTAVRATLRALTLRGLR